MCLLFCRLEIWRSNYRDSISWLLKIDLLSWILWDGQQETLKGLKANGMGVPKKGVEGLDGRHFEGCRIPARKGHLMSAIPYSCMSRSQRKEHALSPNCGLPIIWSCNPSTEFGLRHLKHDSTRPFTFVLLWAHVLLGAHVLLRAHILLSHHQPYSRNVSWRH